MTNYKPVSSAERTLWEALPKTEATCSSCLFGRKVQNNRRKLCECHISRPTVTGFPFVRQDDCCLCHIDETSRKWSFEGLLPDGFIRFYAARPAERRAE